MVRSNSVYLVEEGQDLCQRGLQLAFLCGRPQTSWKNGRSSRERSQKRREWLHMKFRGLSLRIDVSHGDCPIAVSEGRFGNVH